MGQNQYNLVTRLKTETNGSTKSKDSKFEIRNSDRIEKRNKVPGTAERYILGRRDLKLQFTHLSWVYSPFRQKKQLI